MENLIPEAVGSEGYPNCEGQEFVSAIEKAFLAPVPAVRPSLSTLFGEANCQANGSSQTLNQVSISEELRPVTATLGSAAGRKKEQGLAPADHKRQGDDRRGCVDRFRHRLPGHLLSR